MTGIREVTVFVTSDGTQYDSLQAAQKSQAFLDVQAAFREYQDGCPGGMSLSGFFDFFRRNRKLLLQYAMNLNAEDGE